MKNAAKLAFFTTLTLLSSSMAVALSASVKPSNFAPAYAVGESTTIKVVNCADYIYVKDVDEGYTEDDLVDQFINYVTKVNVDSPFYGKKVNVAYSTSDTPETMYNEVKTGKTQIDLICPSDYMIQKMLGEGMLEEIDRNLVPNYQNYCSPTISAYLDNIEAKNTKGETFKLENYCVGYMWGTLGILFNPEFDRYKMNIEGAENMSEEELAQAKYEHIVSDMRHYSALWNKEYDGSVSIKNSIRDTLAVVDMKHFEKELLEERAKYIAGEYTSEEYNAKVNSYFNIYSDEERFTNEFRNEIYNELLDLKRNIFGLEVDSGKNDIVTGKIGINIAWSGDAVYAMSQAEERNIELLYSVPEEGANIWFDGWVMPKNKGRSADQRLLAHMFLDFLSDPYNASQNMDYIGYTSFIAGDDILSLIRDWYDYRTDLFEYTYIVNEGTKDEKEVSETIYVKDGEEYRELDYPDFEKNRHNHLLDEEDLVYGDEYTPILNEDETTMKYKDLEIVDSEDSELFAVDLSYFFSGTLSEAYHDADMVFYAEDYYVDVDEEHPDGVAVGGDFYCQYPDEETVTRCCIMQDFGKNNKKILELWEDFKSGEFELWAIILLSIEVGAALAVGGYILIKKKISKDNRKRRKLAASNE